MNEEKGITRRELFRRASPMGRVKMDGSGCTACGLCTLDCPTEALKISLDPDTEKIQLLFRHGACIGCNICLKACPEHCLVMERGMGGANGAEALFEDRLMLCKECGKPVGPARMLERVRDKVGQTGAPLDTLVLCPECKARLLAVN